MIWVVSWLVACGGTDPVDTAATAVPDAPLLYWTDKDAGAIGWLDPATGEAGAILQGLPDPRGIVVSDGIYWTDADLGVLQTTEDGTAVDVVAGGLTEPADLVRSGSDWLIANRGTNEIVRIEPSGDRSVVTTTPEPYFLAVADGFVWWGEFDNPNIWRAPEAGGDPEVAAAGVARIRAVVVADDALYWTDREGGTVQKLARSGEGGVQVLYTNQGTPHGLVKVGDTLYWADTQSGTIRTGAADGQEPPLDVLEGLQGPWDLFWSGE